MTNNMLTMTVQVVSNANHTSLGLGLGLGHADGDDFGPNAYDHGHGHGHDHGHGQGYGGGNGTAMGAVVEATFGLLQDCFTVTLGGGGGGGPPAPRSRCQPSRLFGGDACTWPSKLGRCGDSGDVTRGGAAGAGGLPCHQVSAVAPWRHTDKWQSVAVPHSTVIVRRCTWWAGARTKMAPRPGVRAGVCRHERRATRCSKRAPLK